jgi:Zn-finger nucleic acid-binding protein
MKAKDISTNKVGLELKYCERCGGLWLRPAGGEQIYCAACGRAMAELPPASHETGNARMPRYRRSERSGDELQRYREEDERGMSAEGGVA